MRPIGIVVGVAPLGYALSASLACHEVTATLDEIREDFRARGITVADWAHRHGFPRDAVYRVLRGHAAGKRGQMHRIAVALGIKAKPSPHAAAESDFSA